jgi:hypothetical protein
MDIPLQLSICQKHPLSLRKSLNFGKSYAITDSWAASAGASRQDQQGIFVHDTRSGAG